MLTPLGFYLSIMVFTCALILLISWVYDTYGAAIVSGRSRPADLEFPIRTHTRRFDDTRPAPRRPERLGVRGRLDGGLSPRTTAQWRLERGTRVASLFEERPDLN
jgi:hypothetical protein